MNSELGSISIPSGSGIGKEYDLAIIVPFCDSDANYLKNFLTSIKDHIKLTDYKVFCVDNRENRPTESSDLSTQYLQIMNQISDLDKDKIWFVTNNYSTPVNLGSIGGRFLGIKTATWCYANEPGSSIPHMARNVTGSTLVSSNPVKPKFVWLCDVDDEIQEDLTDEDFANFIESNKYGIVQFPHSKNLEKFKRMNNLKYTIASNWSRLIKLNLAVETFNEIIQYSDGVFMFEDEIIFKYLLNHLESDGLKIKFFNKALYKYNKYNSTWRHPTQEHLTLLQNSNRENYRTLCENINDIDFYNNMMNLIDKKIADYRKILGV